MKKGMFHIHTHYSYDCLVSPESIVRSAIMQSIDYLVISDHDSIEGSIKARNYARQQKMDIDIPIAAEYLTDIGDVIAVGISDELKHIKNHKQLCATVREMGGYTVLPHPFEGHHLEKIDYHLIDGIEIFNSRSNPKNNERALKLALELKKPFLISSDAHFLCDIKNAVFHFDGQHPLQGNIYPITQTYTPKYRKNLSQIVKGYKEKDLLLLCRSLKNLLKKIP